LTGKNAYSTITSPLSLLPFVKKWKIVCLLILFTFAQNSDFAQETVETAEASISLKISKFGVVEVPAYFRNEVLYLPIIDVFTFLKINNTPSSGYDSVAGFFINVRDTYLIDRTINQIRYKGKIFELKPGDLIKTETNLYLRSEFFGTVFGLQCVFDFRSLTATLTTNQELPVIREMRLELMRRNLTRLKEGIKADTTIGRSYPFFHFGMADWSIVTTQQFPGNNNVWLNLSLGTIIAGGEADVSLIYNNNLPFIEKQQHYLWHYANNDHRVVRQVMLGRVSTTATSSIFSPLVGMVVTNTPTTYRRSFGTYTLSDHTEPGWLVELYVNNVLVDYVKADASGFFTFEVPLVYGNTAVLLRFYGPWGEERSREKNINIPFNFLPPRKLEYTISMAMIEDRMNSRFSRANFNYGFNKRLTAGGGIEYISSLQTGSTMPFVNFSLRLASNFLISAEYTYGVRVKSILSCRLPSNIQLELNYVLYHKDQKAVSYSLFEERKAMLSVPFRGKHYSSLARLTVDQIIYPQSKNLTAELLISGSVYGVSANFTTYGLFYDPAHPYITSTLSLGITLPARLILIPQLQYEYNPNRLISGKFSLEKRLFDHGVLKLSYEYLFLVNSENIQVGMRYDFPFAQAGLSGIYANERTSIVQTARGSLMFDQKTHYAGANNFTSVGKGGIVILPFLDLNMNGKHDINEPKVTGLSIRIPGGRIEENKRDSSIRVFDLEPFTNYFIEIDPASFENVAWKVRKPVISVAIDPNQFKLVTVPVVILGEGSGFVFIKEETGLRGLGGVFVSFYRDDSILVERILTEADGYYNYLGLPPGSYVVRVDTAQLRKIHMTCSPEVLPFTISQSIDGDLVGGLEFVLSKIQSDSSAMIIERQENQATPTQVKKSTPLQEQKPIPIPEKPVLTAEQKKNLPVKEEKSIPEKEKFTVPVQVNKDAKGVKHPKIPLVSPQQSGQSIINTDSSRFHIQVGAFRVQANAIAAQAKLSASIGHTMVIIFEDGLYKLRITGFNSFRTASGFRQKVIRLGYEDAFIHKNR
jgi:hypothetical protein